MKKICIILLATLIVFMLIGCNNSNTKQPDSAQQTTAAASDNSKQPDSSSEKIEPGDNSLQKVLDCGKLRVGAEGNWVPFVYNDTEDDGKLKGYEVEIAEEVAKRLGVTVEWSISNKWDGVIAGLQARRYDAIFCGVTKANLESAPNLVGSLPYNETNIVLVTAKDNTEIKDWTDLKGKLSGNALTGDYGAIVRNYGAELTDASLEQAMELLVQHRIDCHVNSQIAVLNYMSKKPDAPVQILKIYEPESKEDLYTFAALNKSDSTLCDAINEKLTEMIEDKTCYNLAVKYFGEEIANTISLFK
jgi:cystine transport system substrate-binding protein